MREMIDANDMAAWEEWHGMIRRMYNGRCVVCGEWRESFDNFLRDMGRPKRGKGLLRRDAKEKFHKENCYWG